MKKFIIPVGQQGKAKECTDCLESTYFHLSFPEGLKHAPDYVTMPIFSANKKLRGFEHAHFENEAKRQI
jgi:hypothetical protein